jgi:hypothetical protein
MAEKHKKRRAAQRQRYLKRSCGIRSIESLEERRLLACDTLNINDLFGDGGVLDEMQGAIDSAGR